MVPKPTNVTDAELDSLIRKEEAVVVDFWAPWCQPCKVVSPIVEKLAETYGDGAAFVKLNIDENPDSPVRYGIMGVPTLLFFRKGELVDRIVGVVPKSKIESSVQKVA